MAISAGVAEAADFTEAVPDLPLAPGLQVDEGATVLFDKPEGRIATLVALAAEPDLFRIMSFYRETLPELGWEQIPSAAPTLQFWRREGETLTLEVTHLGNGLQVEFAFRPVESYTPDTPANQR